MIKKIKKIFNKYYLAKLKYIKYYKKLKIDDSIVLLESQQGIGVNGNIFYILKELANNKKYEKFEIYVSVKESIIDKTKEFLNSNGISRVNVIAISSKEYFKIISSAKYLVNDNTFLPFFIKKEGQIYLNTWHGTPLKTLGKKDKESFHKIGNAQKNFVVADYLLYPNEYTMDHMTEDYMINNLSKAKALLCGYPRNTAFFDNKRYKQIKKEMNLENKRVYMYMPTWRGQISNYDNKASVYIQYYLYELDKNLNKDEVMYVNLHPIAKKDIDFRKFKNIHEFPAQYETYEFLNVADCLITDYSSVFFDFANTNRKIVLFTYDKDEYLAERGTYFDFEDLPFPKVDNTNDLLNELRSDKKQNYSQFLEKFCKYDSGDATKNLCEMMFLSKKTKIITKELKGNNKNNILIFVGNLAQNGITASLKNLINNIDTEKNNYFLTFVPKSVNPNKHVLLKLPETVFSYSIVGNMNVTFLQKIALVLYNKRLLPFKLYFKVMKEAYKYEILRVYGNSDFSDVIQFNGYEYKKLLLFSSFNCNRSVFVHSNMKEEIRLKNNQRESVLKYCYKNYDNVVLVTDDLIESTSTFTNGKTDNFIVMNNIIDYKTILAKSKLNISFDPNTESNIDFEQVVNILNSKDKKFISVGRFMPEKGHERLINAFYKIWQKEKNVYLFIIGGYGTEYNRIIDLVNSLECRDRIVLIKQVSNPFPIVNKCDYFVLSSFYEGFGIVIAEADILGKPVVSTNICGPRNFMIQNKGTLVDNSEDGIYEGMKLLLENKVKPMNVDYEKYNQNIVKQFDRIISSSNKN